ncbi:MAG: hypothetical protein IPK99_15620 [Flavobacteriales bacterium]|nr:hypothetical protein [Flavobacteriales bacterium]
MRSATLLLSLWCSAGLFAQNWALINPAYKYNYSLGGTDTITNQIFATQWIRLGPDSFRYAFNLDRHGCDTSTVGAAGLLRVAGPASVHRVVKRPPVWHLADDPDRSFCSR